MTLTTFELNGLPKADVTMLHHKRINDVTQHVTQGYREKEFLEQENAIAKGESTYSQSKS